jgi:translation elongation factor aEF-1 beta
MGKFFVGIIEVIPEDTDVDFEVLLEKLKTNLPKGVSYLKHDQIPIAFGLEKLRLQIKFPEEMVSADPIEDAWNSIEGVQRVETIMISKA